MITTDIRNIQVYIINILKHKMNIEMSINEKSMHAWRRFTGMGDRIGVQFPVREIYLGLTNHPSQLSVAILRWVCAMSTGQRTVMLYGWE